MLFHTFVRLKFNHKYLMKKSVLLFLSILLFTVLIAQEKVIIRIQNPTKENHKEFLTKNYDIAAYKPKLALDLVVTYNEYENLLSQGYSVSVIQTEKQLKENLIVGKDLAGYRNYNDVLTELQQIEANNTGICKLYDIGDSRGKEYSTGGNSNYDNYNHEIWAMKVSDNVTLEEDEPYVYYMGEHHAREPISLEVAMYILNHIISNYGTDPTITDQVNNTQIWFMPLVNPDGHKIVTDEDDLWWRKDIRDNNENGQLDFGYSPDGVDPNRNYGWHWGGSGSSGDPYSETYRGPSAFSEPEIQAMKNMIDSYHFVTGITYHSYSELVLFPYGYANGVTAPDHDALEELAINMAVTIPAAGGGNYTPQESWQLYPASGTTDDYSYGEHGIFSFTIELGTVFIPPASQIDQICQDNLQAALILLDRVNHSTLTGIVRDANTSNPIMAEVYIDGIDNTGEFREPYTSDTDFGRYYRLLMDGNYSVTSSAYGYIPQTFNSVNINSSGQTILDVYLIPSQTVTVTGTVTDAATTLPVENATIEVLNTPISPVTTNEFGQYTINDIMEGTYTFRVYAIDYATVMQELEVSVSNNVFDFQLQESIAWSFESGSFEPQWSFGGNAPWSITTENPHDGAYCSQSGNIGDNQNSEMEITLELTSGGDVSFYRKVSSESGYDYLEFYINDIKQGEWAGELDWAEVIFPVTAGEHTFKWVYDKDSYVSSGSDCGWIDYIIFPPYADFPDIDVSPLSFEVTLPVNDSSVEQLTLSNLGEQELDFNISKQYITDKSKAYCSASGGCDEYISRVIFNTIDNVSACSNYADYTSISTNVNAGQTYSLTIENGNVYSSDDLGVWVDWNQDEDFDDTGENMVCDVNNSGQGTFQITVPGDAFSRTTRMRIRMKYYGSNCGSPCGTTTYGEVEDYTLIVSGLNDWLTIVPMLGAVTGQDSINLDLTFNSTDLEEGDYHADVTVNSNDPDESEIIIPCTLHVMNEISVSLKALLEGPFAGTQMNTGLNTSGFIPIDQPFNTTPWNYSGTETVTAIPNANVVDWVLVELRDAADAGSATPGTMIAKQATFLLNDGTIVGLDGSSNLQFHNSIIQQLFIVLWHRNHLGIMSANALTETGGVYNYDFTTSAGQAYGTDSQKEIASGIWGMISGDANADGQVTTGDKTDVWENAAGTSEYLYSDFNLDGQVDNQDKDDYWLPNLGKGTGVPE